MKVIRLKSFSSSTGLTHTHARLFSLNVSTDASCRVLMSTRTDCFILCLLEKALIVKTNCKYMVVVSGLKASPSESTLVSPSARSAQWILPSGDTQSLPLVPGHLEVESTGELMHRSPTMFKRAVKLCRHCFALCSDAAGGAVLRQYVSELSGRVSQELRGRRTRWLSAVHVLRCSSGRWGTWERPSRTSWTGPGGTRPSGCSDSCGNWSWSEIWRCQSWERAACGSWTRWGEPSGRTPENRKRDKVF